MKKLLRNKRLKKNLIKWSIAYIGVLGLLTTAVTFSKYFSSMNPEDEARPAIFEVEFQNDNIECIDDKKNCNIGIFRPNKSFDYKFSIDTSNTEVLTVVFTTITIKSGFDYTLTMDGITITDFYKITEKYDKNVEPPKLISTELKTKELIAPKTGKPTNYVLTLKYNGDDTETVDLGTINDIVHVGYSAKQLTTTEKNEEEGEQ